MTTEEIGGRRFIQCENFACNRRILLEKPNRTIDEKLQASIDEAARIHAVEVVERRRSIPTRSIDSYEPPIPTERSPMAKCNGKLTPEQRQRISEAMKASHERRRAAKGLPAVGKKPPIDITPAPEASEISKRAVAVVNGRGAGKTTAVAVSIDKALEQLIQQEEALRAELDANQEKQGALRKAAEVLQEVGV